MLSSIGVLTVSTSRVVMVMLRSHRFSRWRSTFVPCTPILAMVPPGATIFSHKLERGRDAHRLDGGVHAAPSGHLHHCRTALPSALLIDVPWRQSAWPLQDGCRRDRS